MKEVLVNDKKQANYHWCDGWIRSGKTSVSRAILNNFPDHSIMMLEQDSYYKDQSNLGFEEQIKRITIIPLPLIMIC